MAFESNDERFAGECRYLAHLLEDGGDRNVPAESIRSYFVEQASIARRKGFYCLADTLERISCGAMVDGHAIAALKAHAAALDSPMTNTTERCPICRDGSRWVVWSHLGYFVWGCCRRRVGAHHG